MSTKSELKARLARLGPVRDADPPPSFSGEPVLLVLRLEGPLNRPVQVVQRLRAAGLTLRAGHSLVNRLAENRIAVCEIAADADIPALAADLAQLGVRVLRRRRLDANLVAQVRTRHGLSQREFAGILGIDIDTLQNWEQARSRPDAAALSLIMAFDNSPELVEQAALEPVV
jgi:DNA-binding transcriptional regulator YiaG